MMNAAKPKNFPHVLNSLPVFLGNRPAGYGLYAGRVTSMRVVRWCM
jgi:hypothetical protein